MLDLLDIGLFSAGDPERRARRAAGLTSGLLAGGSRILRHPDALGDHRGTARRRRPLVGERNELEDLPEDYPRSILHMDSPRHTKVRKLLGAEFAPSAVARMEPRVRSIACSLLEAVPAHEEVDFAAQVADVLPMRVIGRLIGIPEADDERFKRWNTISIVEEPYGPVVRGLSPR